MTFSHKALVAAIAAAFGSSLALAAPGAGDTANFAAANALPMSDAQFLHLKGPVPSPLTDAALAATEGRATCTSGTSTVTALICGGAGGTTGSTAVGGMDGLPPGIAVGFAALGVVTPEGGEAGDTTGQEGTAVVDSKQSNRENQVENLDVDNLTDPKVDGNTGNAGANAAAGDFNQQANEAVIAAADAEFVFADAEGLGSQDIEFNETFNERVANDANLQVSRNEGNVGANAAAGTGNQQTNVLSADVANSAALAEATGFLKQEIENNKIDNGFTSNSAFLDVSGNTGNVGANVAAGVNNQQYNALQIAVGRSGVKASELVQ